MMLAEDPACPADALELLALDDDLRVSERAQRTLSAAAPAPDPVMAGGPVELAGPDSDWEW